MANRIPSVSRSQLSARRRQLRWKRRWQFLQTSWQIIALGGLATGLIWALALSDWMLRSPNQVLIEGNRSISSERIRALLPIKYPQFLLTLQPEAIADRLESQAPIAEVTVTRRLFPPSLTVHVQERHPVAVVYGSPNRSINSSSQSVEQSSESQLVPVSLLDEKGYEVDYQKYGELNQSRYLPSLRVIASRAQYHAQWPSLYQQVSQSPVKIYEINWQDPSNLILSTELGIVHFGAYGDRFPKQLRTLDQLRQLPNQIKSDEIAYIDLRDLEDPRVITTSPRPQKSTAPPTASPEETDAPSETESGQTQQ
jgi:cell division protein FtsQ